MGANPGAISVIARSDSDEAIQTLRVAMDRFAEPVIGRAFARPVGSQMTVVIGLRY
jgi:hypothetical protein